jgi:hypothetical protein
MAESNLPGPRANLELAEAFSRALSTAAAEPAAWLNTLYDWARIPPEEAPTGDPREFLPFCAIVSFGVLYNTHACSYPCTGPCDCPLWPVQSEHLVKTVRGAASDSRWRIREAVAISLQHLGEGNPTALRRILDDWLGGAAATGSAAVAGVNGEPDARGGDGPSGKDLMERRAVLAALAHPPLLAEEEFAHYALATAGGILQDAAGVSEQRRKEEAFSVLKKGLGYALSVMVAALPEDGFPLLEKWVESSDPDIRQILWENLKKKRLEAVDPDRVAELCGLLSG